MNPIFIVIPTLDLEQGQRTARMAMISSGLKASLIRAEVIHDTQGVGFTKTVNRGLRNARPGEDICLLNDDIEAFQFSWLRILQRELHSRPSYGLVGPSGRSASTPRTGQPGGFGLKIVNSLPFWCTLIRAQTFKDVGLLDERLIHYSSDTWYCTLARKANWKCVWVKSVFLWHHHQGSGFKHHWRAQDRITLVKIGKERGEVFSRKVPAHNK